MDAPRVTKDFAKGLRRKMSLPEVLVWKQLRRRQQDGLYFRRQHPIGPYVLDFFCDEVRLAIEIDGEGHFLEDQPLRDQRRDSYLWELGIETLRVPARAVLQDVDGAVRMIVETCRGMPAGGLRAQGADGAPDYEARRV